MKAFVFITFLLTLTSCNSDSLEQPYQGFLINKGNFKILLEDIESQWAGGGTSQKLEVFQNGQLVFDTLFPDARWLIDSFVVGAQAKLILTHSSFTREFFNDSSIFFKNESLEVKYRMLDIGSASNNYDSCSNVYIGKDSVIFSLGNQASSLIVPKSRIRFLSERDVCLYFVDSNIETRTLTLNSLEIAKLFLALKKIKTVYNHSF